MLHGEEYECYEQEQRRRLRQTLYAELHIKNCLRAEGKRRD